ncbi:hypothetical protein IJC60_06230 [bacterium]|nr:hypothetical protein [bacterium]
MSRKSMAQEKSSIKLGNFLNENNLHKKDFAQMIGVTLSYIYNLIDETIPFSGRATTLERIATVMDILPEEFEEYIIEDDSKKFDENLDFIKSKIKETNSTTLEYLRKFEKKQRLKIVDILRGHADLQSIILNLKKCAHTQTLKKMTFLKSG